jgi:hypothetical protein
MDRFYSDCEHVIIYMCVIYVCNNTEVYGTVKLLIDWNSVLFREWFTADYNPTKPVMKERYDGG